MDVLRGALAWSWAVGLGVIALAWAVLAAFGWGYSQSFIDDGGCYPGSPVFAWVQAGIAAAGIVATVGAAVATVRFGKSRRRGLLALITNLAVVAGPRIPRAGRGSPTRPSARRRMPCNPRRRDDLVRGTREPGAEWDRSRPMRAQPMWDEHAEFMDSLVDDGFVLFGGPLGDGSQVLLIVRAGSEADVAARLAEDPWTPMRLLRTTKVEPWEILLGAPGD